MNSKTPVTVSGNYEMTDGSIRRLTWRGGQLEDDGPATRELSAEDLAVLNEQAAEYARVCAGE